MRIGKDLEGSSCGLVEALSWHLSGGAEEKHENSQSGQLMFQQI
jgi:hypothetical protein